VPTEIAGGTLLAANHTIGVETTLATDATNKNYIFIVNLKNMVAGDTVELRVYMAMRPGDSEDVAYFETFVGAQAISKKAISLPTPALTSYKATLKQTAGTKRDFIWSVQTP